MQSCLRSPRSLPLNIPVFNSNERGDLKHGFTKGTNHVMIEVSRTAALACS